MAGQWMDSRTVALDRIFVPRTPVRPPVHRSPARQFAESSTRSCPVIPPLLRLSRMHESHASPKSRTFWTWNSIEIANQNRSSSVAMFFFYYSLLTPGQLARAALRPHTPRTTNYITLICYLNGWPLHLEYCILSALFLWLPCPLYHLVV